MIITGCDYHPGFQQIAFVDPSRFSVETSALNFRVGRDATRSRENFTASSRCCSRRPCSRLSPTCSATEFVRDHGCGMSETWSPRASSIRPELARLPVHPGFD
jgi:hypothetical protein